MRLITWNIQWSLGTDGIMDPARIVNHARTMADFDVLCLQEAADNFPELAGSPGHDQFAVFESLLPEYSAVGFAPLELRDSNGKPKRFGNIILTRLPVIQAQRHTLPWEAAATHNMPRGLIEVLVSAPSGPLRIMTAHLEYSHPALRAAQVEAIREIHRAACDRKALPRRDGQGAYVRTPATRSAILAGDFNMPPDDPTKLRVSEPFPGGQARLADCWEAVHGAGPRPPSAFIAEPGGTPQCVDYIFASENLAPRVRSIVCDTDTRVSDHQPILIDIDC